MGLHKDILKRDIVNEIRKYLRTDDIIVLHGARQVGKTSILYYIEDELKNRGDTTHFIDLEDSRFVRILDAGVGEFIKHLKEEGKLPGSKKRHMFLSMKSSISPILLHF